ncbi:MAG TPA: hypothetical protein VEX43_18855, partial [Chthoniobacterales bacterium]|nr:hypothetical protein [Chthoniobacterales bacterium]
LRRPSNDPKRFYRKRLTMHEDESKESAEICDLWTRFATPGAKPPNEKKMSDGGRPRASLDVEV